MAKPTTPTQPAVQSTVAQEPPQPFVPDVRVSGTMEPTPPLTQDNTFYLNSPSALPPLGIRTFDGLMTDLSSVSAISTRWEAGDPQHRVRVKIGDEWCIFSQHNTKAGADDSAARLSDRRWPGAVIGHESETPHRQLTPADFIVPTYSKPAPVEHAPDLDRWEGADEIKFGPAALQHPQPQAMNKQVLSTNEESRVPVIEALETRLKDTQEHSV